MTAALVPALIADLAATLDTCACGALPAACLAGLVGPRRRPCCAACGHHPELPRTVPGMPHGAAVCAAWADEHGIPRGTACEAHWCPDAVGEWRRDLAARAAAERAVDGPPYRTADLVPAIVLYREAHGPDRA